MTLDEIKQQLDKSFANGYYIELPFFSTNESIYLTKSGEAFYVRERYNELRECYYFSKVEKTDFDQAELNAKDWVIIK